MKLSFGSGWVNKLWYIQVVGILLSMKKIWAVMLLQAPYMNMAKSKKQCVRALSCAIPPTGHSQKGKAIETGKDQGLPGVAGGKDDGEAVKSVLFHTVIVDA